MSGFGNWTVQDYVYVTAECLTGVLSVLGNGLVLLAIYRTRALRTVTNCFIGSLAAADILVGVVVPPTVILPYRGLPNNFYGCVFMNTVVVLITNISILNLLAVALERYMAISDPFRYQRLVTVKRAMVMVVVTWVAAILIGLIPTMGWNLGSDGFESCAFTGVIDMSYMVYLIFFGVTLPPLIFMLVIYLYIFHIIRQQQRRTAVQMTVLSRDERRSVRQQKREVRGAKGLAYVIVLFAVCWMPIHILNSITLFAPEHSPEYKVLLAAIVLSHANSFVNPFLYAFSNTQFKRAMKRILFCGRLQTSYSSDSSDGGNSRSRAPRIAAAAEANLAIIANTNGHLNRAPATNGHVPVDSVSSESSEQAKTPRGSRDNGNGVVNQAFNEEEDEPSPPLPQPRKKSLRWCDMLEATPASQEEEQTAMEVLQKNGDDSQAPAGQVWVTPSSKSLQLHDLPQERAASFPEQYDACPPSGQPDKDSYHEDSLGSSLPQSNNEDIRTSHDPDFHTCKNTFQLQLDDVTNDATDDTEGNTDFVGNGNMTVKEAGEIANGLHNVDGHTSCDDPSRVVDVDLTIVKSDYVYNEETGSADSLSTCTKKKKEIKVKDSHEEEEESLAGQQNLHGGQKHPTPEIISSPERKRREDRFVIVRL